MDWYMRFSKEISDMDGNILFKKDNGNTNRRYYIVDEDKKNYYVSMQANDITCTKCCSFSKETEEQLFKVVQE